MAEYRAATPDQEAFRAEVFGAGLLIDSGVAGVYGRSAEFDDVYSSVDRRISEAASDDGAERLRFPPVIPRDQFESSGYLKSFPHLAGTVFGFTGTESEAAEQSERAERHEDWSDFQEMGDLVLTPAACYPVYPAVAARGPLPSGGITVDAGAAFVFRNEPSGDPARMQMFHQRELVRIGEPDAVADWRDSWRDRAVALLRSLRLEAELEVATDPFFGRSGRMMAASQRQQALKFEVQVPIAGPEPTAVASFNYHQRHFGETFGIRLADGDIAHTSCLGFGLERITLALFRANGLDSGAWPAEVRDRLWGDR
jgi:seryl-tRNA synthetase